MMRMSDDGDNGSRNMPITARANLSVLSEKQCTFALLSDAT